MQWNVDGLGFLYRPDVFTGSFDSKIMQERHDEKVLKKLTALKSAVANENNPFAAMQLLHKNDHLRFFQNNLEAFRNAGEFEKTVLTLYGKLNAPFGSGGDAEEWSALFMSCDREALAQLGSPVPFKSATVYRGSVSGFSRSLSWTPNKSRAEKFAVRWQDPNLGSGDIYEMDIDSSNVLIYIKRSREDEIIMAPEFVKEAAIRPFTS